jgi:hypothetical protein
MEEIADKMFKEFQKSKNEPFYYYCLYNTVLPFIIYLPKLLLTEKSNKKFDSMNKELKCKSLAILMHLSNLWLSNATRGESNGFDRTILDKEHKLTNMHVVCTQSELQMWGSHTIIGKLMGELKNLGFIQQSGSTRYSLVFPPPPYLMLEVIPYIL